MCIHNSVEISFNWVILTDAVNATLVNNRAGLTGSNASPALTDSVNQKYYREIHLNN